MIYKLKEQYKKLSEKAPNEIDEISYMSYPVWISDMFEPVNERIELKISETDRAMVRKLNFNGFSDEEIKKMEDALNNELYSAEEIRSKYFKFAVEGWMTQEVAENQADEFINFLKKVK